jgi:hypothetical protein
VKVGEGYDEGYRAIGTIIEPGKESADWFRRSGRCVGRAAALPGLEPWVPEETKSEADEENRSGPYADAG